MTRIRSQREIQRDQLLQQLNAQQLYDLSTPEQQQQQGGQGEGTPDNPDPAPDSSDTGGESGSSGGAGDEDVTALKNTITALRGEVREFKTKASQLETQLSELTTNQSELQQTNQQLVASNRGLTVDLALNAALSDALPDKRDLLMGAARPQLSVADDGSVVAGDKPLSEFVGGLKEKYPDMFAGDVAQGAGAAGQNGAGGDGASRTVSAQNGIITGVDPDEYLAGKVTIQG